MAKNRDITIESSLPVVSSSGLNTNKAVDFSGAPSVNLPAGTVIAGVGAIVDTSSVQTLTNKTLANPTTITGAVISGATIGTSTVNGVTLTTGGGTTTFLNANGAYSTPGAGSGITIGTTTITSGTSGRVLYDNAGVVGELVVTGSGNNVLSTNPTIVKPVINATNPTAQTYSPSAAGTATLDLSLSNQHDITMPAGNITIALSNDTSNQVFAISITQDATGSRTVTWFSTIRWAGGSPPTLTTTANKRDRFVFVRTGSGTYDGLIAGQNI